MNNTQQKRFILPILIILALIFTGCGTAANSETAHATDAPTTTEATSETPATDTPETETTETDVSETDAPATDAPAEWAVFEYDTLTTPSGKVFAFEEASWIELLWGQNGKALIKVVYFYPTYLVRIKIVDDQTGNVTQITQDDQYVIIDVKNAYNTVYWYTANRDVWACHWRCGICEEIGEPILFCSDAIGLSPYGDEREGAIVPAGKGNWAGTNEPFEIFTPYGIGNFRDPDHCH